MQAHLNAQQNNSRLVCSARKEEWRRGWSSCSASSPAAASQSPPSPAREGASSLPAPSSQVKPPASSLSPNRWRRFITTREAWRLLPTNCSMKCANRTCRERWCLEPMTRIDTSLNWCDNLLLRCVGSFAWPSLVLTESCGVWLQGMSFSIRNLTLLRLTRF